MMISVSDKSDVIFWVSGYKDSENFFIPPKIFMFVEMLLSIRTKSYLIKVNTYLLGGHYQVK